MFLASLSWGFEKYDGAPPPRMHHSSLFCNNKLWIFGGRGEMDGLCDLFVFDIKRNSWREIRCKGDIPSPRWSHSMTLIDDKRFVIFGGCSSVEYFNDLYEFDMVKNTWKKCEISSFFSSFTTGISFHSTISHNGKLYVFFGGTYELIGTLSEKEYLISYGMLILAFLNIFIFSNLLYFKNFIQILQLISQMIGNICLIINI